MEQAEGAAANQCRRHFSRHRQGIRHRPQHRGRTDQRNGDRAGGNGKDGSHHKRQHDAQKREGGKTSAISFCMPVSRMTTQRTARPGNHDDQSGFQDGLFHQAIDDAAFVCCFELKNSDECANQHRRQRKIKRMERYCCIRCLLPVSGNLFPHIIHR